MRYDATRLRKALNDLPLRRPVGWPQAEPRQLVVCFFDTAHLAAEGHRVAHLREATLVLARDDDDPGALRDIDPRLRPFAAVWKRPARHAVVVAEGATRNQVVKMGNRMTRDGRGFFWITSQPTKRAHSDLLAENADRILEIVNRLEDETSRTIYLARLKSLMFGTPGFNVISEHAQYFHRVVHANTGDVVADAGIGNRLTTPRNFARRVGPQGKVWGFEPVPDLYDDLKAEADTSGYGTIEVVPMGLWSEPGEMEITMAGNASTLRDRPAQSAAPRTVCKLTSIDRFFADKDRPPSLIKMDIEGAEQKALAGAADVIDHRRPKLQICLYHSIDDFMAIPERILAVSRNYRLFVGHHSPLNTECVLYAKHT